MDTINCNISKIVLHKVGNKLEDQGIEYSNSLLNIEDDTTRLSLFRYFTMSFKSDEYYNFHHSFDLNLNESYIYVSKIFDNQDDIYEQSIALVKHLYEKSTHPKIKAGEFYVVYFKDMIFDGKTIDAVGLFKSENKDTFLKVLSEENGFEIESQQGININKLDKGCLIFNIERENGYIVSVVDNTNKGAEAQYWIDDFLHLRQRQDEYYNTRNVISLYKNFVVQELPQQFDVSKADQADLINKSVDFFKNNERFEMYNFTQSVIGVPEVIDRFNDYKDDYERTREINIQDEFAISGSAVKKQTRALRSVIKLDKNFHIYVHGSRDLIEQGMDEKGMYYKVYYKEES